MTAIPNLLPKTLLAERARRRRIHQWLVVAVMESTLLSVACFVLRAESHDAVTDIDSTIRSTGEQINLMSSAVAESRAELAELERRMAITSEVDRQPDWSIVLAMIAKKGAGIVRLQSCQLLPGAGADDGAIEYKFTILGQCPSQTDVTRFVQALEQTTMFSRIRVVETRRMSEESASSAIRFTIESWLREAR